MTPQELAENTAWADSLEVSLMKFGILSRDLAELPIEDLIAKMAKTEELVAREQNLIGPEKVRRLKELLEVALLLKKAVIKMQPDCQAEQARSN